MDGVRRETLRDRALCPQAPVQHNICLIDVGYDTHTRSSVQRLDCDNIFLLCAAYRVVYTLTQYAEQYLKLM